MRLSNSPKRLTVLEANCNETNTQQQILVLVPFCCQALNIKESEEEYVGVHSDCDAILYRFRDI